MIPSLGVPELVVLLVIILIVFGVGRLPEVGGALGKGIREFRRASTGEEEAGEVETEEKTEEKS
ncbi:MAG: twin-arginine translocase TatA/TatE family subunit [Anaerolineae bacterium]